MTDPAFSSRGVLVGALRADDLMAALSLPTADLGVLIASTLRRLADRGDSMFSIFKVATRLLSYRSTSIISGDCALF